MNRTQRAIKKKRREEQIQQKQMKQKMVSKMKNANASSGLLNHKEIAAQNVKIYFDLEKKARKDVVEYMCCAKNNLKEAVGA